MNNFLSQPTIEAIQTLLIIGNVLSYNMNPGTSYILLGKLLSQFLDPELVPPVRLHEDTLKLTS